MNLLCLIAGHKSKQYLQVDESELPSQKFIDKFCDENVKITRRIATFFLCQRCYQRYKQTEYFVKQEDEG
jgi:hypothetical protein